MFRFFLLIIFIFLQAVKKSSILQLFKEGQEHLLDDTKSEESKIQRFWECLCGSFEICPDKWILCHHNFHEYDALKGSNIPTKKNITNIDDPHYSDLGLFPKLKNTLKGLRFNDISNN